MTHICLAPTHDWPYNWSAEGGKVMVTMTVLGAAGPVPTADNDTSCLVLHSADFALLVDCTGNPIGKLEKAGIAAYELNGVLLTHRHPDHTYGLPLLLQGLGLWADRREPRPGPLIIYGVADVLDHVRQMITTFDLLSFLPSHAFLLQEIPMASNHLLLDRSDVSLWTTPVEHFVPTVGLKVQNKATGKSIVYSSDTSPCETFANLASGSTILIHNCNLPAAEHIKGHSNSTEAGEVARLAHVERLVLIHMPVHRYNAQLLVQEAHQVFPGPVEAARPFATYSV
jgi:ribonuclease Z